MINIPRKSLALSGGGISLTWTRRDRYGDVVTTYIRQP